jgi:hypothetical protein
VEYDTLLYTSRIDSAKEAITRVRVAFLINVLAAFTLVLGVRNGYFSWYRFFVFFMTSAQDARRLTRSKSHKIN